MASAFGTAFSSLPNNDVNAPPENIDVPVASITISSTSLLENEEKENGAPVYGFIFMCNGKTKPECYRYRVFGLPKGKMGVVEKIRPGAKLFLFDFELKLLYGIYEATSNAEQGLEPMAFNGNFPTQVRFAIVKDCLPLSESAFKHAIEDNYQRGTRFKQELSCKQVENLISLFRPITMPSFRSAVPHIPNMAIQSSLPPLVVDPRYEPPSWAPQENSYSSCVHISNALPVHGPVYSAVPYVPNDQYNQQNAHPYCSVPYFPAEAHHIPEEQLSSRDPYRRYMAAVETVPMEQVVRYRHGYHTPQLPMESEYVPQSVNVADYYREHVPRAAVPCVQAPSYALRPPYPQTAQQYYGTPYEHLCNTYTDPLQRPVPATADGLLETNLPISSHYSFAGPTPSYR